MVPIGTSRAAQDQKRSHTACRRYNLFFLPPEVAGGGRRRRVCRHWYGILHRMEELAHQVLSQGAFAFEWTDLAFQQQQRGTPTLLVFGNSRSLRLPRPRRAIRKAGSFPLAIVPDRADVPARPRSQGLLGAGGMPIDILAADRLRRSRLAWPPKNAILIVEFARQKEEGRCPPPRRSPRCTAARYARLSPDPDDIPLIHFGRCPARGLRPEQVQKMRQSLGTAVGCSECWAVTCFGLLFTPAFYNLHPQARSQAKDGGGRSDLSALSISRDEREPALSG